MEANDRVDTMDSEMTNLSAEPATKVPVIKQTLPSDPTPLEGALVARAQRGDRAAFDILVLRHQHRLLKLVSQYVRNPADALDVTQESLIKAYRALPRFRGDSALFTWLHRIAVNTAKNHLEAEKRRNRWGHVDSDQAQYHEDTLVVKDYATPERVLLKNEIGRAVHEAVERLPHKLRRAIILREHDGLSYDEIAETLRIPVGTIRSRIFRAREAINKRLEPLLN